MANANDKYAFIGTAHVLVGAFSAAGDGLLNLGEQPMASMPFSGGNKAFTRTPSGHRAASNAVDYGRIVGLDLELDEVSREIVTTMLSAAEITPEGNVKMHTSAQAIVALSAIVIPSVNIDAATGKVIDDQDVYWLPALTDDDAVTATFNNSRGENANNPLAVKLGGLVAPTYAGVAIPAGMHNYFHGDPSDEGVAWALPAALRPAA